MDLSVTLFLFVVVSFGVFHVFKNLSKKLCILSVTVNSIMIDNSVDKICEKAVIISEYQSHEQDLTEAERQRRSFEVACGIVADVLMQHGMKPKDYNIHGLVLLAQHYQGIIALSQYEQESKKCQKLPDH